MPVKIGEAGKVVDIQMVPGLFICGVEREVVKCLWWNLGWVCCYPIPIILKYIKPQMNGGLN